MRASLTELTSALGKYEEAEKIKQFRAVYEALADAEACTYIGDRIIVTGSFVTVGTAIDYLKRNWGRN